MATTQQTRLSTSSTSGGSTRAHSPSPDVAEKHDPASPDDKKVDPTPISDDRHDDRKQMDEKIAPAPPATAGIVPGSEGAHDIPPVQLTNLRFTLVFASMMLCVFLFALDQLILATAIPAIVSEFKALSEVSWLQNGFFVTLCGFSLAYGQYLLIFPTKYVYLFAIFIFELGSLICAVAPNMKVLILGRAIAGVGAAGLFSCAIQTLVETTTIRKRSTYMGLFGACFGIASVIGPLLGGAMTDHWTWRGCFWINLPFGGITAGMITFVLPVSPPLGAASDPRPLYIKFLRLDWVGTIISLGLAVTITLGLQYGGVDKAWDSAAVIILLVAYVVANVLLVAWTMWLGPERALVPIEFFKDRSILGAIITGFFGHMAYMAVVLYLSISYQSVNGHSATKAGIDLLPMIVVQTSIIVIMGRIVAKWGHYKYIIFSGGLLMGLGCGLIYSVNPRTHIKTLLGVEVFFGIGVAFFLQNVFIALQVELRHAPNLISRAMALSNFTSFVGRIWGIAISTSIFSNLLPKKLATHAPNLEPALVPLVRDSVAAIRKLVPVEMRDGVIEAYRLAIRDVWLFCLAASFCCAAGALLIGNKSLHPPKSATTSEAAKLDVEKQETSISE